ncbi:MAG: AzlD domain-containing protein [Spirochaetales bacterium]
MSVRPEVLLLILGSMAVTIVPRVLPLVLARRFTIPAPLAQWLDYVPVAVIAALLADQLLLAGETAGLAFSAPRIAAGFLALVVGGSTKSVGLTVVVGVGSFALLSLL